MLAKCLSSTSARAVLRACRGSSVPCVTSCTPVPLATSVQSMTITIRRASTTSTMGGEKKDWVNEDQDMRNLPGLNKEQLSKIRASDDYLRNRHMKIEADMDAATRDAVRRKRMIYRSKQRGWLEADLLLGSWAVQNVPHLNEGELDEFELLLKEETIDIYNYISGKDKLPPHLQGLPIMHRLMEYALKKDMSGPEGYARVKRANNLT